MPSIIFGIWGLFVLAPVLQRHVQPWLIGHLGHIPYVGNLFKGPPFGIGVLTAGVVLAIGYCFKFVGPYALGTLGLLELGRIFLRWRDPDVPAGWALRKVVPRFAATVFPVTILIALWAARSRGRLLTYLATALPLSGFFMALYAAWWWVG